MFKVTKQLTNVRPDKSTSPEVSTTPTSGNVKINANAASKIGVGIGDYVAIVEAEDENGKGLYLTKGHAGNKEDGKAQYGSILASSSGKEGTALQFSSENAFRSLGGTKEGDKKVYSVGDGFEHEGSIYYKLDFVRDEARQERKKKVEA